MEVRMVFQSHADMSPPLGFHIAGVLTAGALKAQAVGACWVRMFVFVRSP